MSRSVPWQLLRISLKRKLAYAFAPFFTFPSFCCSECGWDGSIRSSHFGPRGDRAWWKKIKWIWFLEDFFSPTHHTPRTFLLLTGHMFLRKTPSVSFSSLLYSQPCSTVCSSCIHLIAACFCTLPLAASLPCALLFLVDFFLLTKTHFENLLLWKDCSFTAGQVW